MTATHLSFGIRRSDLRGRILIPKYYDPELIEGSELARTKFRLIPLGELLEEGTKGSQLGHWVRREHYGTGNIPYVRTSDLNGWRIRPDFKKGLSEEVYSALKSKQDVQPHDILMVAHGTYLVGAVAIVVPGEEKLVLQDHVYRLRLRSGAPIDQWFLLAALSSRFVRRQVRARQFSADIIDKIGDRHVELLIPVPKDNRTIYEVSNEVKKIVTKQTEHRAEIARIVSSNMRMIRERSTARYGFSIRRSEVKRRILIPKYYDPVLEQDLAAAQQATGAPWVTIRSLVEAKAVALQYGVEVGKLAYGTGTIPFLRTTDIADLEVKSDPRQGVSQEIYDTYASKGSVKPLDVLLVRDGTYLVGSSAIVNADEAPALYCGGIYRFRAAGSGGADPYVLLALLNLPIVRRQMRARQFTRDVIDTLGKRVLEVVIPDPHSTYAKGLGDSLKLVMLEKAKLKRRMSEVVSVLEPPVPRQSAGRPGWSMRA